jgi:hypothetical protein
VGSAEFLLAVTLSSPFRLKVRTLVFHTKNKSSILLRDRVQIAVGLVYIGSFSFFEITYALVYSSNRPYI